MNILLAGGTGFVGGELAAALILQGHRVVIVSRRDPPSRQKDIFYAKLPEGDKLFSQDLIGQSDAVINLAGHNISAGRWTTRTKERILESRLRITRQLAQSIKRNHTAGLPFPQIFINASAVGYYGVHPTAAFDEESPAGEGFLARVCREWEQEALALEPDGIRVVLCRLGMVLKAGGGVFEKISLPYRFGLGGYIGDGGQWCSWIHMEDLVALISLALVDERFRGAVNCCSPQPVTMAELDRALAGALGQRSWTRLPGFLARVVLGEMADELLLKGQKVMPKKISEMNYPFKYPDIASAMSALVKRS